MISSQPPERLQPRQQVEVRETTDEQDKTRAIKRRPDVRTASVAAD
jgi:hypothetical protein